MSFQDLEHDGWEKRAGQYRYLFGTITSQVIEPLLDALGSLDQTDLLDVACGTGELAAAAARRGARALGVDLAEAMVHRAREQYPYIEFREADAQALSLAPASFDVVTCAFGMLHFADPERALRSMRAVLRSGGRLALTTWGGPEQGGEFFEFADRYVREFARPGAELPSPPPMFRFADPGECRRCLAGAGFVVNDIRTVNLVWSTFSPRAIPEMIDAGMIWTSRVLRTQPPDVQERIARAMDTAGEKMRQGGKIAFRFPALLVLASAG